MIGAIGLADALVGVSHQCNWPPRVNDLPRLTRSRIDSAADSTTIDAQVKSLCAAGEGLYQLDAELLAALRPTLVVAQAQCEVCALSVAAVRAALHDRSPLASTALLTLSSHSIEEVLLDVERVGRAAQADHPAQRFAASLRNRIAEVRRQVAARGDRPRPRVAVIEWIDPLMVAGHWTPELVALAGGDYGLAAAGQPSPYVPWEELVRYAPERIIVAPCGFDLPRTQREAAALERLPGWATLPAVEPDRCSWSTATPISPAPVRGWSTPWKCWPHGLTNGSTCRRLPGAGRPLKPMVILRKILSAELVARIHQQIRIISSSPKSPKRLTVNCGDTVADTAICPFFDRFKFV